MKDFDSKQLRAVFGLFATGVTVVTFERGDETFGMTANSFSSLSMEPPMVLFCPALNCRFVDGAYLGTKFTISILTESQEDVCLHFAGRPCLEEAPWSEISGSPPYVDRCLGYLRCELVGMHVYGDHYIAVGLVQDISINTEANPLLFYRGRYPKLLP